MALSAKRAKFAVEYLTDLNGTAAAIRAGFAKKGAATEAQRLLRNAEIQRRIADLRAKTDSEAIATHKECCERLTVFLRAKVSDFTKLDGSIDETKFADPKLSEGVDSYRVTTRTDEDGNVTRRVEFTLANRIRAIERLSRMRGYEAAEKLEASHNVTILATPPLRK